MKRRALAVTGVLAVSMIMLAGCGSSDDNPSGGGTPGPGTAVIQQIATKQEALFKQYNDLVSKIGEKAAMDSVAKLFLADKDVKSAIVGSQGIAVVFNNGVKGGLFLKKLDSAAVPPPPAPLPEPHPGPGKISGTLDNVPLARKTIFLNPHYADRVPHAEAINSVTQTGFPRAGFLPFERYLGTAADLDRFASLQEYGVIHVYSHGWAWPSEDSLKEVLLLTGEADQAQLSGKYYQDVLDGNIVISTGTEGSMVFVDPRFITRTSAGGDGSALFYGGFCYSGLGSWKDVVRSSNIAGTYVGFDWSVDTRWNAGWAQDVYRRLTDTTFNSPETMWSWWNTSPVPKQYADQSQRTVSIQCVGDWSLALWRRIRITSLQPSSGPVGTSFAIRGKGFGSIPSRGSVKLGTTVLTPKSWSDSLITTDVPSGAVTGNVTVTVDNTVSNPLLFTVTTGTSLLDELQKCNRIVVSLSARITFTGTSMAPVDGFSLAHDQYVTLPIVWNGTSFAAVSSTINGQDTAFTSFGGTVSADGQVLSAVTAYARTYTASSSKLVLRQISLVNIPYLVGGSGVTYSVAGSGAGPYTPGVVWSEYIRGILSYGIQQVDWSTQVSGQGVNVRFSQGL